MTTDDLLKRFDDFLNGYGHLFDDDDAAMLTALRASLTAVSAENTALKENYGVATFCSECGLDVNVDEDGCCISCGRDAYPAKDLLKAELQRLAEVSRRLAQVTSALEKITERHNWQPGLGECVCEAHITARKLLALSAPTKEGS